jgi:hypothetical protein
LEQDDVQRGFDKGPRQSLPREVLE